MKRLFALLLLMLMCAGALAEDTPALRGWTKEDGYVYVNLGHYIQTEEGGVLPVTWRVLAIEGDTAYCLSEYVLLNHRIHGDDNEYKAFGGDFRQTEMWAFLNGEFAQEVFTEEELALLVDTQEFGRLFLVSRDDLKNKSYGFVSNKSRRGYGTPWALAQFTTYNGKKAQALFRYSYEYGKHSPYWTRSQSTSAKYAANCTKQEGNIGWIRVVVENEGCRPAMRLQLPLTIVGGEGTLESPYVFFSDYLTEAAETASEE